MDEKNISIIIVNWNGKHLLKTCLDSIFNQKSDSFEVILVDNGSIDNSIEFVEVNYPDVKIISLPENFGFARANNEGIKKSNGKTIFLLNNDTKIISDAIENMYSFLWSDDKIGIVGSKLLFSDGTLQRSCRRFPSLKYELYSAFFLNRLFPTSITFNGYLMGDFDHNAIREVDQVMGAALMIKKDIVDEIGLLDESFFMFYEEVDWCYRVKNAGYKVFFYPNAEIIHYGGGSSKKIVLKILTYIEKSKLKFFSKNYGATGLVGLLFVNLIKIFVYFVAMLYFIVTINMEKSKIYYYKMISCFMLFGPIRH